MDGQLPGPERDMIEVHLHGCPRCAREAEDLAVVDRLYAQAGTLAPDAWFGSAVHRRIRKAEEPAGLTRWFGWRRAAARPALAIAAALLLVAATAFWTPRSEARSTMTITCRIEGMMCEQCDRQVHRILQAIPGVESVQLEPRTGRARMRLKRGGSVSVNELTRAVDQTRQYRITNLEVINEEEKQKAGETK